MACPGGVQPEPVARTGGAVRAHAVELPGGARAVVGLVGCGHVGSEDGLFVNLSSQPYQHDDPYRL